MTKSLRVLSYWDEDAKVWVALSDDVPGLATEAETIGSLTRKLNTLVPELLELNNQAPSKFNPFEIAAWR